MHINLFSDMINKELGFLLPRTLVFDCVLFIVSLPFYGPDIAVILGLAAGSFIMLLNFVILGAASQRAVERPVGSAKRYMFGSYLLRFGIVSLLFIAGIKLPFINLLAASIPQLYPKFFYTLNAALIKKKGG